MLASYIDIMCPLHLIYSSNISHQRRVCGTKQVLSLVFKHWGVSLTLEKHTLRNSTGEKMCVTRSSIQEGLRQRHVWFRVPLNILVFHSRCFSVAMAPHCWSSRRISRWRLVNPEAADVTKRDKRQESLGAKACGRSLHPRNENC